MVEDISRKSDSAIADERTGGRNRQFLAAAPRVNITGEVDYESGAPANDTFVFFNGAKYGSDGGGDVTDNTGTFSASVESESTYDFEFQQRDVSSSSSLYFPRDGNPDLYAFEQLTIGDRDIDVGSRSLPSAHPVNITIVGEDGTTIDEAYIQIGHENGYAGTYTNVFDLNSDGKVVFEGKTTPGFEHTGTLFIRAIPPTGSGYTSNATKFEITGPSELTLVIEEAVNVSGTVEASDGTPVVGGMVQFNADGPGRTTQTWTGSDGTFTGRAIKDETVDVGFHQVRKSQTVDTAFPSDGVPDIYAITELETTSDRDLGTVSLPAPYNLTIEIVDRTGDPVSDAEVQLSQRTGAASVHATVVTDSSGSVPVETVGALDIDVEPPSGSDLMRNSTRVTVDSEGVVTVTLRSKVNVTGRLVTERGTPASDHIFLGTPLGDPAVFADSADAEGRFDVGLASGRTYRFVAYQIDYSGEKSHFGIRDGLPDLYAVDTRTVSNDTDFGEVSIPDGHVLNVTVVDQSGTPVEGAEVDLIQYNDATDTWTDLPNNPTNADGMMVAARYDPLETVGPQPGLELTGNVTIEVRPPETSEFVQETHTRRLTVTNDTDVTIQVQKLNASVTGRLVTEAGTPASEYTVLATPFDDPAVFFDSTDYEGRFDVGLTGGRTYEFLVEQFDFSAEKSHFGVRDGLPDVYALEIRRIDGETDVGDLMIPDGHVLNVTVLDGNGAPVQDARVDVIHHNDATDTRARVLDNPTNAEGKMVAARFGPLETVGPRPGLEVVGNVTVRVHPPANASGDTTGPSIRRLDVTSDTDVTVQLNEGNTSLTGQFTLANGSAAVDDLVVAFRHGGNMTFDLTDTTGGFELFLQRNESYSFGYYQANGSGSPDPVTAYDPEDFPRDGNVDMYGFVTETVVEDDDFGSRQLPTGHVVDVVVEDESGAPVRNATVSLVHWNATHWEWSRGGTSWTQFTRDDGRIYPNSVDSGLELTGNVTISVRPPQNNTGFVDETYTRNVTVTNDTTIAVQLEETRPTVTGQLTLANGSAVVEDLVVAWPQSGTITSDLTDASGRYELTLDPEIPHSLGYYQGNGTENLGSSPRWEPEDFPRDGNVDMLALANVTVEDDTDLGNRVLPDGHVLDVVVEDESGSPVRNASVSLFHYEGTHFDTSQGSTGWIELTRDDGRIYPNSVDSGMELTGNITVRVTPPENSTEFVDETYERNITVTGDRTLTVQLAETSPRITGQLTLANGSAAADDFVVGFSPVPVNITDTTDAAGNFELRAERDTPYSIGYYQADDPYPAGPRDADDFVRDDNVDMFALANVTAIGNTGLGDRRLPEGHVLDVVVVDGSGSPVSNATVQIHHWNTTHGDRSSGYIGWTQDTRSDGRIYPNSVDPGFELTGNVSVRVDPPDSTEFEDTRYFRNITVTSDRTLTVQLEETRPTVSGQLTLANGSAAANHSVSAVRLDNVTVAAENVTDADGNFRLSGLERGIRYSLGYHQTADPPVERDVFGPEFVPRDGNVDIYAFDALTLSGDTDLGDRQLPEGHVFDVVVRDESGAPLEDARMLILHYRGEHLNLSTGAAGRWQWTAADGHIYPNTVDRGLELTGNVTVTVYPPENATGFVDRSYRRNVTVTENTTVNVTLEETEPYVAGRILFENGTAAANQFVYFRRDGDDRLTYTVTDSNGEFSANVMGGSNLDVYYTQANESVLLAPRDGIPDVYQFARVENVGSGTDLGTRTIPAGHVLDIRVENASGDPIEGANVSVYHEKGDPGDADEPVYGATNATGLFEHEPGAAPGLELAGNVTVEIRPPDSSTGFVDKTYRRNVTVEHNTTMTFVLDRTTKPDLAVDVSAADTQYRRLGVNATVNVTNVGGADVTGSFDVEVEATNGTLTDRTSYTVSGLSAGERNVTVVDLSAWARANRITGDVTVNASVVPVANETATDNNRGTTTTTVEYRRLGDLSGDGSIDVADANATARAVANGTANDPAADANDDGVVNSVDAMFIAQRANGVRDANYELIGGD